MSGIDELRKIAERMAENGDGCIEECITGESNQDCDTDDCSSCKRRAARHMASVVEEVEREFAELQEAADAARGEL